MSIFAIMPGWYAENFIRTFSKALIEKERKEVEEEAKKQ
jgi:hypothetical protein